ncbi:MAG: hypothetical protein ABI305_09775 [Tepidiformaceae bacterium]
MPKLLVQLRSISPLFASAGVVVALALFGSGVLVARATMETDGLPPAQHSNGPASRAPAIGINIASDKGGSSTTGEGGTVAPTSGSTSIYAGDGGPAMGACGTDISAALSGAALDPAKLGFQPNLLKDGFSLTGLSFRSEAPCTADGKPADAHLVMTTQWTYGSSGIQLAVTQRQTTEPVTNAVVNGTATFFADGYAYDLWANGAYPIAIPAGPIAVYDSPDAPAEPAAPDTAPAKPPSTSAYPGGIQQDPNIAKAIDAALTQLAPAIGAQCFYRQVEGTWADLASLGIGDPRSAIPANLKQTNFQLNKYDQPAPGCPSSAAPDPHQFGPTLNTTFAGSNTFLNISANAVAPGDIQVPGFVGDDMANWANGKHFFYVSGQGPSLTPGIIRSIAAALDPGFANACFVSAKAITAADVAGLGVHVPSAPNGFRLDSASLTSNESSAGCPNAVTKGYSLTWTFFPTAGIGSAGLIEAGASLGTESPNSSPGFIGEGSLVWQSDAGTRFHVSGFKGDVPRDTLLGMAKSMDPAFSESRLESNPATGDGSSGTTSSPPAPKR